MTKLKDFSKVAQSFVSEEVKSPVLDEGNHVCRLVNYGVLHSAIDNKGEPKSQDVDYEDVTPQVYVEFGSTEGKGAIAHRYNIEGYLKFDNLTPEEKESGDFEVSQSRTAYALVTDKQGKKHRVVDEENTAAAHRILSQAFKAFGLEPGSSIDDLQTVIDEKREFNVNVRMETYNGNTRAGVKYVSKAKKEAGVTAEAFN